MDQYNSNQNEFLWMLLANPANDAHLYAYNLQRLVNDFPQSGILQALLAHASDEKNLKQASVYFNPQSLYKLINAPSSFIGIPADKIIVQTGLRSNKHQDENGEVTGSTAIHQDQITDNNYNGNYFNEEPGADTAEVGLLNPTENESSEEIADSISTDKETGKYYSFETVDEKDQTLNNEIQATEFKEDHTPFLHEPVKGAANNSIGEHEGVLIAKTEDVEELIDNAGDTVANENLTDHQVNAKQYEDNIEDETFEEIGGVESFVINQEDKSSETNDHDKSTTLPMVETGSSVVSDTNDQTAEFSDETEKLIIGSIASSDYFKFNNAFGEDISPKQKPDADEMAEDAIHGSFQQQSAAAGVDQQDVSKYHDEKMPYTFMWWLDKTRKEHSGIYQPYTKTEIATPNGAVKNQTDELQQQYYENIFHITSFEELEKNTVPKSPAIEPEIKQKEQVIIERFIQEEPQIRPQSSDKLDNENKAKKSSEDRDELVTETLAAIYSDQMLYHKAIASYKKLILKFPEKSRYFAEKIEQLEKKTN